MELGVKRSVMLDIGLKEVVPKIVEVSDIKNDNNVLQIFIYFTQFRNIYEIYNYSFEN
jgi:hypothetical protein